jgi:hypothetical protein
MDVLTADDVETSRRTPPAEKLKQALELSEAGIALKRAALRHASPQAPDEVIDAALERWLLADD